MMDLANDTLDDSKIDELINKMFRGSGRKDGISYEEFQKILSDYQSDIEAAKLDLSIDGKGLEKSEEEIVVWFDREREGQGSSF